MPNSETKNFSQNVSSSYHLEDKNKNVPKLRFKGYNDEWVEKSFDEIFQIIGNNTFSRDCLSYEHIGTKNIHYGDILVKYNTCIDEDYCKMPIINPEISLDKIPMENYLKQGDIVIADTAEDYTVGKTCEVININSRILSGLHTIPSRPKFHFAKGFLGYYFNSNKYHDRLIPLITGIKVLSINKKEIKKTIVKFPTLPEQEKIASFLTLIDKKIEKQKELVKLLKKYKRGLFKSIFDTISDCKAVLLENIANLVKGTQLSKIDMIVDGKYYVLNGGTTPSGKTNSYNTIANTISISEGGNSCGYVNYNIEPFWSGGHCYTLQNINSTMNKRFLYHYLKFKENNIMMLRIGSGLPNIQKSSLLKFQIIVPELKIQNKYSKLFDNIENYEKIQIELLDKISYLKKALLQQMFI